MLFTHGLRMQGIANRVKLHFGEINEMQAKMRAETRQIEIQNIVIQMDAGLITLENGQEEIDAIKNERHGQFSKRPMPRLEHRQHFAYALPNAKSVRFLPLGNGGESKWIGGSGGIDSGVGESHPAQPHASQTCQDHAAHTGANLSEELIAEFAVQISPEGSEDALPVVPTSLAVTDADANTVRRQWNTF